jgi:hypothetical protein
MILILFTGFIYAKTSGQNDSLNSTSRFIHLSVFNGITLIDNNMIKEIYKTGTFYYFGFGLNLGDPYTQKVIPYVNYEYLGYSSYFNKNGIYQNKTDTTLKVSQVSTGVILPIKLSNMSIIQFITGLNMIKLNETRLKGDNFLFGFKLGLGYDRKLNKNLNYFIELTYDLNRSLRDKRVSTIPFQEMDMLKINIGLRF